MLDWSDKLLDQVEATLERAGWLGKTADAVLNRLLSHDTAQASCIQCGCDDCWLMWGQWCWNESTRRCEPKGGPCSPPGPC
jgi:hypothetical protein